ncbi:uncharacterized protein LOC141577532 isoform X2 [Camelus bactrianus]|uniref:Uncharacterized protein LOC141577532 isoform X2 n=10 Tax=Camelus bactrianus TaxID=9837 RepID=A0AC58Q9S8_CAMBA
MSFYNSVWLQNNFILLHAAGGSHVGQHGPRDFKLLAQTRPGSSWWDPSYSLGLFLPIQQVPHGSLEASPLVPSCLSVLITSCQVFQPAPEHQPELTSALFCPDPCLLSAPPVHVSPSTFPLLPSSSHLLRPSLPHLLSQNPERITGPPVHAQSVPAGTRVGSSSSEQGIGPKFCSALSPGRTFSPAPAPRPQLSRARCAPAATRPSRAPLSPRLESLFPLPPASPLLPGCLSSAAGPSPPLGGLCPGTAGSADPDGGGRLGLGLASERGYCLRPPPGFPCPATPGLHSSPFPSPWGPAQCCGRSSPG